MTEASGRSVSQWLIAARWFERAEGDLRIAATILAHNFDTIWGAAFHCEQELEKLAKGTLIGLGIEAPKIHDIEVLANLVGQRNEAIVAQIRNLAATTAWHFTARYPGGLGEPLPSAEEVESAIEKIKELHRRIDILAPQP